MTIKWIKTAHKGLRYYEHETRKHGKKKDRYYSIRFKVGRKDYTYGVGWWSDGIPDEARQNDPDMGFEEYCLSQIRLYKANQGRSHRRKNERLQQKKGRRNLKRRQGKKSKTKHSSNTLRMITILMQRR